MSQAEAFRSGFVTLIGRPNVGKSSLVNRLVGEHVAIVSSKAQTTRRRILGVLHGPGLQIVWVDTPGVHQPRTGLGRWMMAEARQAVEGVEAVCLVLDAASTDPGPGDAWSAGLARSAGVPVLVLLNRADLVPEAERADRLGAYRELCDGWQARFTSAVSGEGLESLVADIGALLPPGPRYFPPEAHTNQPEELLAAELVREQALRELRDEVPHALAVTVDAWQRRPNGVLYVAATLTLERESQKGIVIGRGGAMLRAIGEPARLEISRRLATPVYLDLRVKVKEGWRDRPGSLQTLGFDGKGR